MLKDRPEVSVETILKGNDKLTSFIQECKSGETSASDS